MSEIRGIVTADELAKLVNGAGLNLNDDGKGALLPSSLGYGGSAPKGMSPEDVQGLGVYMQLAQKAMNADAPSGSFLDAVVKGWQGAVHQSWEEFTKNHKELSKAVAIPGDYMTYARMSYMPDPTNSNILPWPIMHPEALRKIVMENLAPNLIIGMRTDDILMYAEHSNHLWKPGWRIELLQGGASPSASDKKAIREAEEFIYNSSKNFTYAQAIEREDNNLTDFARYLVATTRDTLTYDMIALSTDRDSDGRVVEYSPVPAGNIRFVGQGGYEGDKEIYAVAVDEGGTVKHLYKRSELYTYARNVRTDPTYSISMTRGYGTPEITIALKLIQIFQNVIDFNSDIFQRSGVPHGMMLLTGKGWNQKQVDVLSRMWHNLRHGISKVWALPVMAAPAGAEVEIVDFSRIKGDEAFYQDLLNLSIGCYCAIYRFPPHRLGYRISGAGPDSKRERIETPGRLIDDDDPGKVALLGHHSTIINQVMIWPRWPNVRFVFTGKEPKADAREYEARRNAYTFGEARAEADLPALADLDIIKKNPGLKELAALLDIAPIDPNMSGVFQSIAAAHLAAEAQKEMQVAEPGANFSSSKDPAKSEQHGKVSGVSRNSRAEKNNAGSK